MKSIVIIPARYASSRFPGKPLAEICGKPMIRHVYESVLKVKEIDDIYVATDDERIFDVIEKFGGKALMTSKKHTCGTERLAECAEILALDDKDIILNIQGDEPLIHPEMVRELKSIFEEPDVLMGTLKRELEPFENVENPNIVKVVTDLDDNAIYFSRHAIPFKRNDIGIKVYKHIGVYGYRKDFLMKFSKMEKTPLEQTESLEQLRVIENGYKIKVKETKYQTIGVDTPEQIALVEEQLMQRERN